MRVIHPPLHSSTLQNFILETNRLEHNQIDTGDYAQTLARQKISPFVSGHLDAIKYGLDKLVNNFRWPADHCVQWETESKADTNLYWLKDLHKYIMRPISLAGDALQQMDVFPFNECGSYRLGNHKMGLDRMMPKPTSIKSLLWNWYKTIGEFHLAVVNKLHRPDNKLIAEIADMAQKAHNQLVCIHPFSDGTGRHARLVENLLRFRWGLPWKITMHENSIAYVKQIVAYEDGPEWQAILDQFKARV